MKNSFVLCSDLIPLISNHTSSDIAFILADDQSGILVYESHRDFLSAPQSHAVLRLNFTDSPSFCSGGQFLDDAQWDEIESLGVGIYRCQYSSTEAPAQWHYVFFSPLLIFECIIEDVVCIDTAYGNISSFSVLKKYLT